MCGRNLKEARATIGDWALILSHILNNVLPSTLCYYWRLGLLLEKLRLKVGADKQANLAESIGLDLNIELFHIKEAP